MYLFKVTGQSHNSTEYVLANEKCEAINEWIDKQDKDYEIINCYVVCPVNRMLNATDDVLVIQSKARDKFNPHSPEGR